MGQTEDLSDLIGAIYACSTAPDGWATALDRVSRYVGAACGHFLIFDRGQIPRLSIVGGVDPASGVEYDAHYAEQDPRMAGFFARHGQVVACQDVVDVRAFERTEFVNDFLIPWEARWCMAASFTTSDGLNGIWAAMRGQKQGKFTNPERHRLSMMLPHISRAADMQFRLNLTATDAAGTAAALDALIAPVFLLDVAGRLVHRNEAAETALTTGMPLRLVHGALSSSRPPEAAAIAATTARIAAPAPLNIGTRTEDVPLGDPPGAEGRLLFYRLSSGGSFSPLPGRAAVLVLWNRPNDHALPPDTLLRARWGLTVAEAALSLALAGGERMADIAARNAVSAETLRTQLKNVFAKTSTHRQADLMRLLHTEAAGPLRL